MLTRVIKAFLEAENADEKFVARIDGANTIRDFADVVEDAGLELTKKKFNNLLFQLLEGELSDDDLNKISAGCPPPHTARNVLFVPT